MSIQGKAEDDEPTQLTLIFNGNNEIVGYGGSRLEDPDTLQIAFRIFDTFRKTVDSGKIVDDFLVASLAREENKVNYIRIPKTQLYNPGIAPTPSVAPLLYKRKGFSSKNLDLETRYSQRQTDRDNLVLLSQEDLYLSTNNTKYYEKARKLMNTIKSML